MGCADGGGAGRPRTSDRRIMSLIRRVAPTSQDRARGALTSGFDYPIPRNVSQPVAVHRRTHAGHISPEHSALGEFESQRFKLWLQSLMTQPEPRRCWRRTGPTHCRSSSGPSSERTPSTRRGPPRGRRCQRSDGYWVDVHVPPTIGRQEGDLRGIRSHLSWPPPARSPRTPRPGGRGSSGLDNTPSRSHT